MVSAATEEDAETTLEALSAGAFDCPPKQLSPTSLEVAHIRNELVSKIRAAAQSRRTRRIAAECRKAPHSAILKTRNLAPAAPRVVAIGVSTGGPKALEQILPRLPSDFPIPILIVQHMPIGFTTPFAQRLSSLSSIKVKEATQGERIYPGSVYIAPAGLHMRVVSRLSDSKPAVSLDTYPADAQHFPSIDVMMTSVAQVFRNRVIGVFMTGMGSDGSAGMSAIFHQGGLTIGQDEDSCAVYGMPRVCAQLGVLTHIVPLSEIPGQIIYAARRLRRA
jgi:two-component system chemotaxis response regulator CheB